MDERSHAENFLLWLSYMRAAMNFENSRHEMAQQVAAALERQPTARDKAVRQSDCLKRMQIMLQYVDDEMRLITDEMARVNAEAMRENRSEM